MKKNISDQSLRLLQFVEKTGYNYSEFARQCSIRSTRTLTKVLTDGNSPTSKMLDKIIKRFPQLNHDWVVLGYGEMIVKGIQKQPANANSLKKSMDASYENIQEYLENHDYALNYLANKIEKALLSSVKTFQQVNDRLSVFEEKLENVNLEVKQNWKKYESKLDNDLEVFGKTLEKEFLSIRNDFETVAKEHLVIVDDLDKKRMNFLDTKINVLIEDIKNARADHLDLTNDLDKKRMIYLNESFESIKKDVIERSNLNTKKAMDFLLSIKKGTDEKADKVLGEFKKHTNPKLEK